MNIEKLKELAAGELPELLRIHNYIRIKALLRHDCQISKINGVLLNDLTVREIDWGIRLMIAEAELQEIDDIVDSTPEFTRSQLNAMKKAELVDMILGEVDNQDPVAEPLDENADV